MGLDTYAVATGTAEAVLDDGGDTWFFITVDYAFHGDWSLGTGDLRGRFDDFSILASYFVEGQDLTIFGGYRRFEVPAQGHEGIFQYEVDFTFDGYVFGVEFLF